MKTREEMIDEAVRAGFAKSRTGTYTGLWAMRDALRHGVGKWDLRDIQSFFSQPRDSQGRFMKR